MHHALAKSAADSSNPSALSGHNFAGALCTRRNTARLRVFQLISDPHASRSSSSLSSALSCTVNDAPALKLADIGISMGKGGTDVAKESADVILVDDNFSTILAAVEEGKGIFFNIQNFLSFQLSTAIAALVLITLSTAFRLKLPLNPMQILFINILMDGPPSQSLGVDPVDPRIMKKPPRRKNEPVITRNLLYRVAFSASIIVLGTLYVYTNNLNEGQADRRDQTMVSFEYPLRLELIWRCKLRTRKSSGLEFLERFAIPSRFRAHRFFLLLMPILFNHRSAHKRSDLHSPNFLLCLNLPILTRLFLFPFPF